MNDEKIHKPVKIYAISFDAEYMDCDCIYNQGADQGIEYIRSDIHDSKVSDLKSVLEGIKSCIENPRTKYPEIIDYAIKVIDKALGESE